MLDKVSTTDVEYDVGYPGEETIQILEDGELLYEILFDDGLWEVYNFLTGETVYI